MRSSTKPLSPSSRRCAGFGLVELSLSVVILAGITAVLVHHLSSTYEGIRHDRAQAFAYAKAQAILEEIQAVAAESPSGETADLDALDDGGRRIATLTTAEDSTGVVAPDHPLSENWQRDGQWVWSRQVSVRPFQGADNRGLRYVTVTLRKRDKGTDRKMAEVGTVVTTLSTVYPTTQVYDVFFLNVENIPGWWVMMESIGPFAEAVIEELESQNPGLEFRTHWITKASYGRNELYRPHLNVATDSRQPMPSVYWYPGRMPNGQQTTFYYPPSRFHARMSFDGTEVNGYDATTNPHPYSLADFYNHAMRLPQEKALHKARVDAVRARKISIAQARANRTTEPPPLDDMSEEPTLRLLLEDLNSNPEKYRNALFVNLHGELVPFPSLRNYSDAAKLPDRLPGARVVTHPEELRTHRDPAHSATDPVRLRVYGYTEEPDSYAGPPRMPEDMPILLQVMDMNLADGTGKLRPGVRVQNLRGGIDVGGSSAYFPLADAKHKSDARVTGEMYYTATYVDPGPGMRKYTLFELYNTPLVATPVNDGGSVRGLANNVASRLYGLEYVPSCTESALDFSRNLYTAGDGPKNTARWVIEIPPDSFAQSYFVNLAGTRENPNRDVEVSVVTRIANPNLPNPLAGGRAFPTAIDPDNESETYTWWASSMAAVPWTERSQFQGDPRHNPYRDLYDGNPDAPNGYNWFHTSLRENSEDATGNFPGLRAASLARYWDGRLAVDVPRYYQLLRRGVVESKGVFAAMNGWSFYYLGIGNEIGADTANGYPNSIPVTRTVWGGTGAGYINNITTSRTFVRSRSESPYMWWGIPWLGELYPDSAYTSSWLATDAAGKITGNLKTGTASDAFFRLDVTSIYRHAAARYKAHGTDITPYGQRPQVHGCTAMFNVGTTSRAFHHRGQGGNAVLSGVGEQLVTRYGLPLPRSSTANRPFSYRANWFGVANEFNFTPWSSNRYTASLFRRYFNSWGDAEPGAVVELQNPAGTSSGHFVVNGLSQSVVIGTDLIAKVSVVGALHAFLELGSSTNPSRPAPLPRVEIQGPSELSEISDPTTIDIDWDISWKRWDGKKYTDTTSDTFTDDDSDIVYAVLYSNDNGHTWRYVQDDAVALPGDPPDIAHRIVDTNTNAPERFILSTPSTKFPKGRYLIRVEAHRENQAIHYAWHQTALFIERP